MATTKAAPDTVKEVYRIDSITFGGVSQQISVFDENGQHLRHETREIPATTLPYNDVKRMARELTDDVRKEFEHQRARLDAYAEVDTTEAVNIVTSDNEALAAKKAAKAAKA
ncbi:MAG: hypothetical protein E6R03_09810 [Hyphomicrobiaceae bacterium]|nr:MAG: hypothetical protein E6R03_09810 [Hyphomicrobiaceae bacterium]